VCVVDGKRPVRSCTAQVIVPAGRQDSWRCNKGVTGPALLRLAAGVSRLDSGTARPRANGWRSHWRCPMQSEIVASVAGAGAPALPSNGKLREMKCMPTYFLVCKIVFMLVRAVTGMQSSTRILQLT
jgi:hypothetical protein